MAALFATIAVHGPVLVGVVLLLAGFLKALDAMTFVGHLHQLTRLPFRPARVVGPLFLTGECALGTALAVGLWPEWIRPAALVLLVLLAALSVSGLIRGDIKECGCYGELIQLSLPQSLALDAIYIGLLAVACWVAPELPNPDEVWKVVAAPAAGALAMLVVAASFLSVRKRGRPLIIWSPIRTNVAWQSSWLSHPTCYALASGEHLVAFLSMGCPNCHVWMSLLRNAVHPHPELPDVLGVIDLPQDKRADLQELLGFPLVALEPRVIRRLAWTRPLGVLVKDGIIREVWASGIPETFHARLRAIHTAARQDRAGG